MSKAQRSSIRLLLLLIPLLPQLSRAVETELDETSRNRIRQSLEQIIPDQQIDEIRATPLPNVYEVQLGLELIYIDGEGRYALRGDLLDLQERRNLSEDWQRQQRARILNRIPRRELIEFAPKKTRHVIYVFTDVQCGYCRIMHQDVPELNQHGVAVRYLAYPVIGDPGMAHQSMESVWCSEDRRQALTRAKRGDEIERRNCNSPVSQQFQLGQQFGITGTPAIYLADGSEMPGYVPAQQLIQRLEDQAAR